MTLRAVAVGMGTEADRLSDADSLRGHTLLELRQRPDGTWVATQFDVDVTGTGETGALAAMDYCRRIAAGEHEQD
jgi:hypothetical protein